MPVFSLFLNKLCDLADVSRPDPAGPDGERTPVSSNAKSPFLNPDGRRTVIKRIELFNRECFVLWAEQGSNSEKFWSSTFA